ncbi:hypothetical protein [Paenibacillus chitinolyticus]
MEAADAQGRHDGRGLIGPQFGGIGKHRFGCETLGQTERDGLLMAFSGCRRSQRKRSLPHRIVDPSADIFRFLFGKKKKTSCP